MRQFVWLSWCLGVSSALPASEPAQQIRCGFQIPQSKQPNLTMVTHGWNANIFWLQEMERQIDKYAPETWDTGIFDWRNQAGNIWNSDPADALYPAFHLGQCLGAQIVERGYDRVHLIGHSAGGELMAAAVEQIKQQQPSVLVHLTLLDPYSPGLNGLWQGQSANWTDQYFTEDGVAFLFPYLRWTDYALPHAHAVDISSFDPIFEIGHIWVHDWYTNTIRLQQLADQGYGWPLTMETQGEKWTTALTLAKGATVVLGDLKDATPIRRPAVLQRMALDDFSNLQISEQSKLGLTVSESTLVLQNNKESSWVRLFVDLTEDVNTLNFTSSFITRGDGLAAAYFNNQPVRVWQEEHAKPGPNLHTIYLKNINKGRHELAFRLDGSASWLSVSDIFFSQVDLRVPGDVTSDNKFNSADLVQVFQRGKYEDEVPENAVFSDGDWNNDSDFDSADLVYVFQFGIYEAGAQLAVPEPSACILLLAALLWLTRRRFK